MRIVGLGNDLVDIRRIEKALGRHGERFKHRVFTQVEIEYCQSKGNATSNFAKRFAAKEAGAKALGTGFAKGVFWKDIEIINDEAGKPVMTLTGGAKEQLDTLVPEGMCSQIDLSITDEFPMAQAVVIITALSQKE